MKHFITFQKLKSLSIPKGMEANLHLAHAVNHELMNCGYVLSNEAFENLSSLSVESIQEVHTDISKGLRSVMGHQNHYEPIYTNFPKSVIDKDHSTLYLNAILHYWSHGTWRPTDLNTVKEYIGTVHTNYKEVGLLSEKEFQQLFLNILYSGTSISLFDKRCIDWYIDHDGEFDLSKISFQETKAYVGARLMDKKIEWLPTRNATNVLRIWSQYSGGDEGLKTPTRFKNPTVQQREVLLRTLDRCYNLEDSLKNKREQWLRLLHYLHPSTSSNRQTYPTITWFTERLRNNPKELRTINAQIEQGILESDDNVFVVLQRHPGQFMRRLDQLLRTFGESTLEHWWTCNPTFEQLVTIYNHFCKRDKTLNNRTAILANQSKSELVKYASLDPLPSEFVDQICNRLLEQMQLFSHPELIGHTVFLNPNTKFSPLLSNNRASNLSLSDKAIGEMEIIEPNTTLRMFVHWEGYSDIDLSGFTIAEDGTIKKYGWNGLYYSDENPYIVYSGDNTGFAQYNAEYLDINISDIPEDIEWIITESRIYSGPATFSEYKNNVFMGWSTVETPFATPIWLPQLTEMVHTVSTESNVAILMAFHPKTKRLVHLDISLGMDNISTDSDAQTIVDFLNHRMSVDTNGRPPLSQWDIIELLADSMVDQVEDATVNLSTITSEYVHRLMSEAISPSENLRSTG